MSYLLLVGLAVVIAMPVLVVRLFAVRRGPAEPWVALTIDDGPNVDTTQALLDALALHQVPATFFCVAEKLETLPALASGLVARGHELENHSFSHPRLLALWPSHRAEQELRRAQDVIASFGATPRYFRAVAGVLSPPLYRAAKRVGLTCVHWTASARDGGPFNVSAPLALRRLQRGLVAGGILVMHDHADAAQWIGPLKRAADERGLRFVLLCELLTATKTASSRA